MTDPLHVEGERLPASGFGLVPAQHHVGVAHLAGADVCGRERNSDLSCGAKGRREKKVRSVGRGLKKMVKVQISLFTVWGKIPHSSRGFCPAATILPLRLH